LYSFNPCTSSDFVNHTGLHHRRGRELSGKSWWSRKAWSLARSMPQFVELIA
jgi:hypothetical protein